MGRGPLLAYFGLLLGIALVRSRRMNHMSDYVLGGRRLGSFTIALSAGSSTTSAWTMLALPRLAFSGGLVEIWIPIGAVVGIGLSWTRLAGRLRRFTIAANDALTNPRVLRRAVWRPERHPADAHVIAHHRFRGLLRQLRSNRRVQAAGDDFWHRGRDRNRAYPPGGSLLYPSSAGSWRYRGPTFSRRC